MNETPAAPGSVSRRSVLRWSAVAAGSALTLGAASACTGSDADAQDTPPSTTPTPGPAPSIAVPAPGAVANPAKGVNLFTQSDLNFETLLTLGAAGYGAAEVGEVIATVNQINQAKATYDAYYDNFVATAERVGKIADDELKAGHRASARSAYLRSASYFDAALFFVLATKKPDREAATYAAMQRQWNLAAQLLNPPAERVKIPYEKTTLPGYFLTPAGPNKKRPTVIVNNGSDLQNVDTYVYGGAAALERGWNALIFEGPGQGSMLFEREVFFRPDWEHVITPIVDYLRGRHDVDPKRIGLTGWSFGGELVSRAAAFEHRLAAVVADPGLVDVWLAFPPVIRDLFRGGASKAEVNGAWKQFLPHLGAPELFNISKRAEIFAKQFLTQARAGKPITDLYTLGTTFMKYTNKDVVAKITAPMLVTGYELEAFYPGQDTQLYNLLRTDKKHTTFTTAEGAEYHCAPMAPQRRNQVVFDWLDQHLG